MSAFQEIIGSVSRQKEEVLSQESRDELKDAVLQLVSYHYDNTVAVSEVTDLLASSSHDIKGVLKSCISVDNNPETGSLHMLEDCVSAVLKLAEDMQSQNHNTDIKEKIIKKVLVIQEVVDRQAFNRPRLLNLLCNEMTLPVYLIWVLNKEAIMALNTYISFKNSSLDFAKAFANELFNSISLYNEESWFLEILTQLVQSSLTVQKNTDSLNVKKISKHILELLNQKILDELSLNGGIVKVLDLTKFCPVEMLKQYYQGLISLWLAHRPVLKVAEALKQQKDWIFSKLSPSLTQWYKQCLVTLEPLEVLEQLKFVMDSQEVNWQTVLSFLSTAVVCVPQFSDLVQDYIVSLLNEGLVSCNLENLVIAFLFARQGCYEGPHVFSSYPDWFQSVFSEATSTPAANRKTFACLMKFLTDMVPFESTSHLKAHIVRPPFVPLKCRELLTDYILLAKTRLADLKQPLDGALEEDQDIESRKKMNEQIEDDIQKAVVLYQSSKKIPSSIMEASIFRKPYYVGKFLPVLLKPRALPDIPDLRMKFIDALKQVDKIPSTLYTNYLKACKAESARLLEGVFLEEDMDLELSEEEQLQFCLDELLKEILDNPTNRVVEQCSLLREKLKMVLHIEENRVEMYTSEPATVLNVNAANISPLQIKVVDQLLEFLACACQRDIEMSTAVSWPQDLFSVLQEMAELHNAIFIRIWKLIMEQGRDLDHHHIRTLGFCLAHTDHMTSRETTVQVCQGFCPVLQGNFTHLVWQELPISTSSWKKFSFRLMLEYIDFVSSIRKADVFQFLLPNVFCDKFQFLHGFFKDLHPDDQVLCRFGQLSKEIKSAVSRTQLAFRDWVQFEMETTFLDDILSFADWQVHVHSTVFNSYLLEESSANGSIKDNNRKIIGELFTQLLQQEMSLKFYPSSECKDCTSKEVHKHTEETHLYFISVLQTLISYLMPGKRVASWLAEQIQDEMVRRESNLEKEFCIQAIFRIISWFPAFRLFADSPSAPSALDLPCQIINQNFTCLCRCGYFPAREAIYMLQGLSQLENAGDVECVLLRCPLLSLSLVVHTQFTRNLIAEIYKKHTNPGLEDMLKITDWVERSRTTPAPLPGELDVNVSMRSAALLSLLHTRSLTSLMEIIRKQARSSEDRQDRVFEGFSVLLVAELIEVKSQFYEEAEQALENLLFSKPELLSYLASNMGEWELVLPQNVLHQMPFTLIKFLSRRKNTSWQSSLTYLSSVLLLHKKVVRCMDQQVPSENLIQMNDWIDVIGFVKGCFNSATKAQLKNVTKELLSDCGADIVLMYKQAIAREQ